MILVIGKVYNLDNSKTYYTYVGTNITNVERKYIGAHDPIYQFQYINKFGNGITYKDQLFVERLKESSHEVQLMYGK